MIIWTKKKLEKEVKEQKASDEKELLTNEINKMGGLFENIDDLEDVLTEKTEKESINILQRQLQFRKTVLGQKFPENKWLQMGEKGNNDKYKKFDLETLKNHLISIFDFLTNAPVERANLITIKLENL